MLKKLIEQFRTSNEADPKEGASDSQGKTEPVVLSTDKIKAIILELNNANQTFTEAGFIMEQLDVEIGLTSKLTPHFKQLHEISDTEEKHILSQVDDKSMIKFVLMSLFRSIKMRALFDNTDMYFFEVTIDIATEPTVKTCFKRAHSVNENLDVTHH